MKAKNFFATNVRRSSGYNLARITAFLMYNRLVIDLITSFILIRTIIRALWFTEYKYYHSIKDVTTEIADTYANAISMYYLQCNWVCDFFYNYKYPVFMKKNITSDLFVSVVKFKTNKLINQCNYLL